MGKKELVKLGHDGKGFTLDGERLRYIKEFKYETKEEDGEFRSYLYVEVYEEEDGRIEPETVEHRLEVDDSELYVSEFGYTPIG